MNAKRSFLRGALLGATTAKSLRPWGNGERERIGHRRQNLLIPGGEFCQNAAPYLATASGFGGKRGPAAWNATTEITPRKSYRLGTRFGHPHLGRCARAGERGGESSERG